MYFCLQLWVLLVYHKQESNNDKKLNDLAEKVPDIAMGKYQLPEPPTLKQNMDINVQVSKQGDQERGR